MKIRRHKIRERYGDAAGRDVPLTAVSRASGGWPGSLPESAHCRCDPVAGTSRFLAEIALSQ